ncbi:MAG TPA: hypothetical protein VH912_26985 [Streptosporangiaceae bacterium]|jgi:hypothetical protein
MLPAIAGHQSEIRHLITRRLATEFMVFSQDTVARCVADVWACAEHLGLEATPPLVERIAREHLTAMVKSEPPSGRFP